MAYNKPQMIDITFENYDGSYATNKCKRLSKNGAQNLAQMLGDQWEVETRSLNQAIYIVDSNAVINGPIYIVRNKNTHIGFSLIYNINNNVIYSVLANAETVYTTSNTHISCSTALPSGQFDNSTLTVSIRYVKGVENNAIITFSQSSNAYILISGMAIVDGITNASSAQYNGHYVSSESFSWEHINIGSTANFGKVSSDSSSLVSLVELWVDKFRVKTPFYTMAYGPILDIQGLFVLNNDVYFQIGNTGASGFACRAMKIGTIT